MTHNFKAGLWRLADPKISLASFASLFLGTGCALSNGPIPWLWLALVVFGIFCIEVAKNASGEIFDFDSGTDLQVQDLDRSPFSGGKRVLVDKLLSRRETWAIAMTGYALGLLSGMIIVFIREPRILWLGLAGMLLAYTYHAPPFKLSYRGFGEIAVGLCYGPGICSGTYLVLRGHLEHWVSLVSLPLGLLIAAFLWINEFPDHDADRGAGKRNWVVRLGKKSASRVFAIWIGLAGLLTFSLPFLGAPTSTLAGLVALWPGFKSARTLWAAHTHTRSIIPAQASSLLSFLAYALATGTAIALIRH